VFYVDQQYQAAPKSMTKFHSGDKIDSGHFYLLPQKKPLAYSTLYVGLFTATENGCFFSTQREELQSYCFGGGRNT
jgi:hypothetical protein